MSLPLHSLIPILMASGLVLAGCDKIRLPGEDDLPRPPAGEEALMPEPTSPADAEGGAVSAQQAELPQRPGAVGQEAAIDWEAARQDLAARPLETREGAFQIASGEAAPPVPVFLPSEPVTVQGGEAQVRFQPMTDGYYAFFPGEDYDIIVNGTNKVIAAPGETVQPRSEAFEFRPTTTGAQVAFSRYGADYLVEYECKELTNGLPACITEEAAVAFAKDLVISGTR